MPKNIWTSFPRLFKAHPRPWTSGIDTTVMKGGIIDANGTIVLEDDGSQLAKDRAATLAFAVNELTDEALTRAGEG